MNSASHTTDLYIKNMVCQRCIRVVKEDLAKLDFKVLEAELGRVQIEGSLSDEQSIEIDKLLQKSGFERLHDPQDRIIEAIKTLVIGHIRGTHKKPLHSNFSTFLGEELGISYYSISKLFSRRENMTLERYIILQKVERVKELLLYDEKRLKEIASDLGYSSVAHLSGQFKKITGLSPTAYKIQMQPKRFPLDQIDPQKP